MFVLFYLLFCPFPFPLLLLFRRKHRNHSNHATDNRRAERLDDTTSQSCDYFYSRNDFTNFNGVSHINKVTLRRARLVQRWPFAGLFVLVLKGVLRPKNELAITTLAMQCIGYICKSFYIVKFNLIRLCSEKTIFKLFILESILRTSGWFIWVIYCITRGCGIP